jgi:hypothetical protein
MDDASAKMARDSKVVSASGRVQAGSAAPTSRDLSLFPAGALFLASPAVARAFPPPAPMPYRFLERDFADIRLVSLPPQPGGFEPHPMFQRNSDPRGKVAN